MMEKEQVALNKTCSILKNHVFPLETVQKFAYARNEIIAVIFAVA